jgi:hypothetical protein
MFKLTDTEGVEELAQVALFVFVELTGSIEGDSSVERIVKMVARERTFWYSM